MQWIQEKNPYLAFRLLGVSPNSYHFPKLKLNIANDAEVIFIEGVVRAFDSLVPFLERGGKVVFVEKNIEKIGSFLALSDFIIHPNIEIILDEEIQYQDIAKKTSFKKHQFIGKISKFRQFLDQYHMALSEYGDLGKTIIRNIQGNLLHSKSFINGAELKDKYLGKPVIVCGSGPSLEENREKISEMQERALIFAAGSSIPKLISWGVRIDAGLFVDPWPPLELYESIKEVSFPLYYQNRMSEELFKMHRGPKIWMGFSEGWEIEKWIYKEIGLDLFIFDAGWNVGCFALHVAHFLGCESITLIGMDGSEKRDLKEGALWMKEFIEHRPNLEYQAPSTKEIDRKKLEVVIRKLNNRELDERLNLFLSKKISKNEKILLEVDLEGEPLYELLIKPLWNLWKFLYLEEGMDEVIAMALFAKRVLKFQQTYRFYPDGNLYEKETGEGLSELFYESGERKARVYFSNNLLSGEFFLYSKNGVCLREGKYKNGKKEGIHIVRGIDGGEILIAEFKEDVPVNRTIRKNDKGIVIEELFYHNREQFDRRLYTEIGELKCEGIFQGDCYFEKQYDQGNVTSLRNGVWREGKLIWD